MIIKRFITAIVGLVILVAAVWFDTPLPWFTVLGVVWGLLAVSEFYRLTGVTKVYSLTSFGLIWTVIFIVGPHFASILTTPRVLSSAIVLSLILLLFRRQKEQAWANWSWMMAGILYLGWLLSYLIALKLDGGKEWIFLALFATFASDSSAFFIGKAIGRHQLAPVVSPGKTWEGAIGGIIGSVIVSLLVFKYFKMPLDYAQAALFGILVSVMGQFGDSVKSLLKRNVGVKESGTLLPGHGGILDRTDSVVFAGLTAYYFFLAINSGWLSWL